MPVMVGAGNFHELERTKTRVRGHRLLSVGATGGLVRMRHRLLTFLEATPLLFIGAVVAIAVLFRVAIGLVRPTSADVEPSTSTPSTPSTLHETPRAAPSASSTLATGTAPSAQGAASASTRALAGAPRKKPRTHGRR